MEKEPEKKLLDTLREAVDIVMAQLVDAGTKYSLNPPSATPEEFEEVEVKFLAPPPIADRIHKLREEAVKNDIEVELERLLTLAMTEVFAKGLTGFMNDSERLRRILKTLWKQRKGEHNG